MTPPPDNPIPNPRDPRRRLIDDLALRGPRGRLFDGGKLDWPPRHVTPDDDGSVASGAGVAGALPPVRTKLGDPPPGWQPGAASGPLRDRFGGMLTKQKKDRLWFPHLLIRTHAGDRGQRPVWPSTPSWLSPDIHLFPTASVPPGSAVDLSQAVLSPQVGETYTVGVHIWNLGRFPAHGVRVKVWWVEPGFFSGIPDPRYNPHYIGGTWAELGDRESGHAHGIVLIPDTWTIQNTGMLHQCLLATVECPTDHWTGVLDANHDRHVGQRNLTLVDAADDISGLMASLGERLDRGAPLTISVAKAGRASLKGAESRHMASSAEEAAGAPVKVGKPRRLAVAIPEGHGLVVTVGKEKMYADNLGNALALVLGSGGLTGKELMAGKALKGMGLALVHLSTKVNGYSLLIDTR
jgi:hypothetical protein